MATSFPHEPESTASIGAPRDNAPGDAKRPKPARRTLLLAGLLFIVAFAWSSGLLDRAAALGVQFFELYAQSQLAMIRATGNVVDGRAEYAVLLDEGTSLAALKAQLGPARAAPVMRYERESAFPGWIVISVTDGDRAAIAALKSAAFTRLAVPNRGLWICH